MRRFIIGGSILLAMFTLSAPTAGAASLALARTHTQVAHCTSAATGHTKVTRSEIAACKAAGTEPSSRCLKGHVLIIVKVAKVDYGLRQGQKPVRIGNANKLSRLASTCGSPTATTTVATAPTTLPAVTPGIQIGPGPQTTYTVQSQPALGSCHYAYVLAFPLPDPHCTPGAINPQVTQANIGSTICRSHYTSTIRPPEDVTEKEKVGSAAAYDYTGSFHTAEYDHLISLELGGDPNDPANLWVEPNDKSNATSTSNTKDVLENKLKSLVCSGQITLAVAQSAIATNWVVAYQKYDASATATPTTTTPVTTPPVTTPPATAPPATAPAGCHPLTSGGNCYRAGELCGVADHGLTGVAGNGETITCEDNNGWRWEPT